MPKTTYKFVSFPGSNALDSYNRLYVESFVAAMNEGDFRKHPLQPGMPTITQGWSWGLAPRYFDGRVTTKRTSWVYGRKEDTMPEGACALVYFKTQEDPIGYLVKEN